VVRMKRVGIIPSTAVRIILAVIAALVLILLLIALLTGFAGGSGTEIIASLVRSITTSVG